MSCLVGALNCGNALNFHCYNLVGYQHQHIRSSPGLTEGFPLHKDPTNINIGDLYCANDNDKYR